MARSIPVEINLKKGAGYNSTLNSIRRDLDGLSSDKGGVKGLKSALPDAGEIRRIQAQIRPLADNYSQLSAQLRSVASSANISSVSLRNVSRETKHASSTAQELRIHFRRASETIRESLITIGSQARSAGQALTIGISAPLTALGVAAAQASIKFESARLRLETITGSAAEAKRQFEQLAKIAKLPAIDLPSAVANAATLQAQGFSFERSRKILTEISNVVARGGGSKDDTSEIIRQLTQIQGKQRFTQQDFNVIAERAPEIGRVLREQFGGATAEALRKSGVTVEQFFDRLLEGLSRLDRAKLNPRERLENIRQDIERALVPLGDAILKIVLPALERLTPVIERLSASFAALSPFAQNVVVAIAGIAAAIGPALVVLGTLASSLSSIITLAGTLAGGSGLAAITAALPEVVAVIAAVIAAAVALYAAWKTNFGGVRDATNQVIDFALERFNALRSWFTENGPLLIEAGRTILAAFQPVIDFYSRNIRAIIIPALTATMSYLREFWSAAGDVFRVSALVITGRWSELWATIRQIGQRELNRLTSLFGDLLGQVANLFDCMLESVRSLIPSAFESGNSLGTSIARGILTGLIPGLATAQKLIEKIVSAGRRENEARKITDKNPGLLPTPGVPGLDQSILAAGQQAIAENERISSLPKLSRIPAVTTGAGKGRKGADPLSQQIEALADLQRSLSEKLKGGELTQLQQTFDKLNDLFAKGRAEGAGDALEKVPPKLRETVLELLRIATAIDRIRNEKAAEDFSRQVELATDKVSELAVALADVPQVVKDAFRRTEGNQEFERLSADLDNLIEKTKQLTNLQRINKEIANNPALQELSPETLDRLRRKAQQTDAALAQQEQLERSQRIAQQIGDTFSQAFRDAFERGPKAFFDRMAQAAKETLARIAAEILRTLTLRALFGQQAASSLGNVLGGGGFGGAGSASGSGGGGGILGGLFGGNSENGGILGGLFRTPPLNPNAGSGTASGGGNPLGGGLLDRVLNSKGIFGKGGIFSKVGGFFGRIFGGGGGGSTAVAPEFQTGGIFAGSSGGLGTSAASAAPGLFSSLGATGLLAGGALGGSLLGGKSPIGRLLGGVGGGLLGGALGASGFLGSGIASALPALFSNPITAIIGAGLLGGALLFNLLGNKELKSYKKLIQGEYGISVKDDAVLKQIRDIGKQVYGKEYKKHQIETIRLQESQDVLSAYAKATGQKGNGRLIDKETLGDPFSAANSFVRRIAGGIIPGLSRGYDHIPLLADAGEYVINTGTVKREGLRAFNALNAGEATITPRQSNASQQQYSDLSVSALLAELRTALAPLRPMRPGDVLVAGTKERPGVIGDTLLNAQRRNQGLSDEMSRNQGLL